MRRFFLLAAGFALIAPKAFAAGKKEDASVDGRVMESTNLVLPVVRAGRLVSYIFATVRVELSGQGNVWQLKERSHFLRDSLIRAAHRQSLGDGAQPPKIDQARAMAALTAAAEEALGAGAIRRLAITQTGALDL